MVENFREKNSSSKRSAASLTQHTGNKDWRIETMDRLSDLTKHVLDDILAMLPEEDVARTSILSKAWNDAWSTFPILRFSLKKYVYGLEKYPVISDGPMPMEMIKNNFATNVEKTLTRYHDQYLDIREFKLDMEYYFDSKSIYPRVDHWIRMVLDSGTLQVLDLKMLCAKAYCLPASILNAKSLIKLKLKNVKFDQALVDSPIQFSSLQELSLTDVRMRDEQIIQKIISCCPLIEYLSLISCRLEGQNGTGLKSIRIHSLRKLKSVVALKIQEIDIDAPNLEELQFSLLHRFLPFKTNLDKCTNLKKLSLSYLRSTFINDQWLLDLFLKFPLLESLELSCCNFSKKIKISSVHLQVLALMDHFSSNLKEINIDAPNLCSFVCHVMEMPTLHFMTNSTQLHVEFSLFFISHPDLRNLRQFLQDFEHRSILASLSLEIHWPANEFDFDVLQDVSIPPPSIKHLYLWLSSQLDTCLLDTVIGLLYCCCPTTISVRRDDIISDSVIEAFCSVLSSRERDECYCSSRDIKCWWHGLRDVQITRTVEEVYDKISIQLEYQ